MQTRDVYAYPKEPEAWFEVGDALLLAKEPLLAELAGVTRQRPRGDIRVMQLGLARDAMLLTGFALENYLKGVAVFRKLLVVPAPGESEVKLKWSSFSGAETHDLLAMAGSLNLTLTPPQKDLLARATTFATWASRYPSHKLASVTSAAYRNSELRLSPSEDRQVTNQLVTFLRQEAARQPSAK